MCPLLAAESDRQAARERAGRGGAEGDRVREDALGTRLVGAHVVPMVAGAPAPAVSDVAANEQHGRKNERGCAVAREEQAPSERRQRVRRVVEGEELPSRFAREVLRNRVVPAQREDVHERRQHEEDAGERGDAPKGKPTSIPIYASATYTYDSMEEIDKVFAGETPDYIYTRYGNPTVAAFENLMGTIEGGATACAYGSGMAALHAALFACELAPGSAVVAFIVISPNSERSPSQPRNVRGQQARNSQEKRANRWRSVCPSRSFLT